MKAPKALDLITDFRDKGMSWFQMATIIDEVSRCTGWVGFYKSNADWLKAAAAQSGYQATVVRRMLRVRNFLERMTKQPGIDIPLEGNLPLASLEVLERMFPIAPEQCKALLHKAIKGEITLREVQKEYSAVTQNVESFHDQAVHRITEDLEIFCGEGDLSLIQNFKCPLFILDAIAITSSPSAGRFCVGFDIKPINFGKMTSSRNNIRFEVAFVSQFFDRFWLIMSGEQAIEYAKWITGSMQVLGLLNVAVAVWEDSFDLEGHWRFFSSASEFVFPQDTGFFPPPDLYTPGWKHLLYEHVAS